MSEAKTQHHWILPRNDHLILWEKLGLRGNGVKISIFVNQLNINKPEFDLAWIRLKYFRIVFVSLLLLRYKLTNQSYLHIRLKSCHRLQPYSNIRIKLHYKKLRIWYIGLFSVCEAGQLGRTMRTTENNNTKKRILRCDRLCVE